MSYSRLEDVKSYELFDTPPDDELDEITELASLICDTPISLVTILDDKRQWFKSNKGLDQSETDVKDAFCRYALNDPHNVLVVNDALTDARFLNNRLVVNDPFIRFYAGAPLVTRQNNVLGTLCVIDRRPREITGEQERALKILAKRVMVNIELHKLLTQQSTTIRLNTERLIKITENIPVGIFELTVNKSGRVKFTFLSKGINKIHPNVNLNEWIDNPREVCSLVHPDDIDRLEQSFKQAIEIGGKFYCEYRALVESGYEWHALVARPERKDNGDMIIYGSFMDISQQIEYKETLEQMAFDISHVLRKPVTSMLTVTNWLEMEKDLCDQKFKEYTGYIKTIAEELEAFTRKLNDIYSKKKDKIAHYNYKYIS